MYCEGSIYFILLFEYFQEIFKRLSKLLIRITLFRNDFRIFSRPFQKAHFPGDISIRTLGAKDFDPGYIVIPTRYIMAHLWLLTGTSELADPWLYPMVFLGRELDSAIRFKLYS